MPARAGTMKRGEEHDEDDEGLHDALSQIPDRFIVAEEDLDGAVHAEFSRYVPRLLSSQPHEAGPEVHQTLFDPTASLEAKREMLVRLARRGTVDAYSTSRTPIPSWRHGAKLPCTNVGWRWKASCLKRLLESSQQGLAEYSIACGILWPSASRVRHCPTRSEAVWNRHGARYASDTIPSLNKCALTKTTS